MSNGSLDKFLLYTRQSQPMSREALMSIEKMNSWLWCPFGHSTVDVERGNKLLHLNWYWDHLRRHILLSQVESAEYAVLLNQVNASQLRDGKSLVNVSYGNPCTLLCLLAHLVSSWVGLLGQFASWLYFCILSVQPAWSNLNVGFIVFASMEHDSKLYSSP